MCNVMNENKENIHQGRNIRFFRNAKQMKQEDFAERIGVTQPVVTKIERQNIVEASMLLKCAEVLGVSVETLEKFDPETMFDSFINHINKVQNTNCAISISKEGSTPTQNYYPIEKLIELHNENVKLYERLLQAEKEKSALFEKMVNSD